MSSDGVEATTSTSSVDSSGDLLDRIVRSVLDGEEFRLPDYFPEEFGDLQRMKMTMSEMQKLRMIVFLLMVVLGLMAAHMVFVTSLHIVIAKTMKICVDAALRADEFVK